ncbi:hypothetical protein [Pantoea sp. 18069]|uniref:hypothetical protein n=1 Tax=Pantoea sp. 18069 TaxID=2681415 RepID=UPI00190F8B76|nr:hypothetical protein [Pantoea sp. 18069]
MAALPSYVKILLSGAGLEYESGVERSPVEKGLAKMRVTQYRVVAEVAAVLFFKSTADTLEFEKWYFETIERIGFFDVKDVRTGQMRSMRFKDGHIGKLEPMAGKYARARRQVTLEYLR